MDQGNSVDIEEQPSQLATAPSRRGRWWKERPTHRHSGIIKAPPLRSSWGKKLKQRANDKMVKMRQAEIREALAEKKATKLQEKKEREERRKANERNGEVVQVIRNSNKLQRAKKKLLRKMEMRDISSE